MIFIPWQFEYIHECQWKFQNALYNNLFNAYITGNALYSDYTIYEFFIVP